MLPALVLVLPSQVLSQTEGGGLEQRDRLKTCEFAASFAEIVWHAERWTEWNPTDMFSRCFPYLQAWASKDA